MNVYMYQADLYCEDCGEKIKKSLKHPVNPADDDMPDSMFDDDMPDSMFDSDEYPKGPYPDGGGEADYPHHCGNRDCGVFLENPLTSDGYNYAQEQLQNKIAGDSVLSLWFDYYGFTVQSSEAY